MKTSERGMGSKNKSRAEDEIRHDSCHARQLYQILVEPSQRLFPSILRGVGPIGLGACVVEERMAGIRIGMNLVRYMMLF